MSSNNDFKPGLEGVVAVETEIAEPDREGGSLRYRGVDIEELVGHYPYENVWGLLVDNDLHSSMPDPEPYEPARLTGDAPADLQAETARIAGEWRLGKLNEISDEQAREDLGRLSAQMMSIVARSARIADGETDVVPDDVVARGRTAAEKFLLRWRGEADPRHVRRSTRTGSAPRNMGSTRQRSPRALSPRRAPTAARRCRRRWARSPGRCTAGPRHT